MGGMPTPGGGCPRIYFISKCARTSHLCVVCVCAACMCVALCTWAMGSGHWECATLDAPGISAWCMVLKAKACEWQAQ